MDSPSASAPGGGRITPAQAQAERGRLGGPGGPARRPAIRPGLAIVRRIARLGAALRPDAWHRAISRMLAIEEACDALREPDGVRAIQLWRECMACALGRTGRLPSDGQDAADGDAWKTTPEEMLAALEGGLAEPEPTTAAVADAG
jgi:hypothetical protein